MGVVISNGDVPSSNDVDGVPILVLHGFVVMGCSVAADVNSRVYDEQCCRYCCFCCVVVLLVVVVTIAVVNFLADEAST